MTAAAKSLAPNPLVRVRPSLSARSGVGGRCSLLLLIMCLASCDTTPIAFPAEFDLLTVSGASNVERYKLQGLDAKQLSYVVNLEFPQKAIDGQKLSELQKRGWKPCSGTKDQWDSYLDNSISSNPRCVHRFVRYFVKQND